MKTLIGTPGHDTKSLFKRCGCVNPATGRRSGARCPQLADPGHGTWYFTVELTQQCGSRQRLSRGGYATCAEPALPATKSWTNRQGLPPAGHGLYSPGCANG